MIRKRVVASVLSTAFLSAAAFAHPGHGPHGVAEGPLHFFNGFEHVAAALAAGVLALVAVRSVPGRGGQKQHSGRE